MIIDIRLLGWRFFWELSPDVEEPDEAEALAIQGASQPMEVYSMPPGFRILGDGSAISTDT